MMFENSPQLVSRVDLNRVSIRNLALENVSLTAKRDGALRFMEQYDPPTARHQRLVNGMTIYLGRNILHINPPDLKDLDDTSALHDMGKFFVPISYLHVASYTSLTPAQIAERKRHIEYSAEIVEQLGFPARVVRMVRFHEAQFDKIKGHKDLYSKGFFLPSLLRVADILAASHEHPMKYGKEGGTSSVLSELFEKISQGEIQDGWRESITDLLNEFGSHLPIIPQPQRGFVTAESSI